MILSLGKDGTELKLELAFLFNLSHPGCYSLLSVEIGSLNQFQAGLQV